MSQIRVFVACDHAAFDVKQEMVAYLQSPEVLAKVRTQLGDAALTLDVVDCGPASAERVDYPDYAAAVCRNVVASSDAEVEKASTSTTKYGFLLCGSGIGMSMAANKFKGIRAALCHDHYTAAITRAHNNANVLCAGARTSGIEIIKEMAVAFLGGVFEGGRHGDRVAKICALEA